MTKAAICVHCSDIVAPRRAWQSDRSWRWCECDHMGVRWRDGDRGLLEVTALHGVENVLVLGLSNAFLGLGATHAAGGGRRTPEQWRALHELTCQQVEPHYLFHTANRNCWALLVRPGESGDVFFIDYAVTKGFATSEASSREGT